MVNNFEKYNNILSLEISLKYTIVTFASRTRYAVAQDTPEEQRAVIQVLRAPGRRYGASAQLATFFFRHVLSHQILAQTIFAHRSPTHATCNTVSVLQSVHHITRQN